MESIKYVAEGGETFPLEGLDYNTIIEIALGLNLDSINKLCRASRRFNRVLCDNKNFWRLKYIKDFGEPLKDISKITDWKKLYRTHGEVFSFGSNDKGQLGLGDTENKNIPMLITSLSVPIKHISAGGSHSLLLDEFGGVWSCGSNEFGQLGLGDRVDKHIPTKIDVPKMKSVCAGYICSLLLDEFGKMWAFGSNNFGQLGSGNRIDKLTPTLINSIPARIKSMSVFSFNVIALDENSDLWVFGRDYGDTPRKMTNFEVPFKSVSAGYDHFLLIDITNRLWGFGDMDQGQLGNEVEDEEKEPVLIEDVKFSIRDISAGNEFSLILGVDGIVWSFGNGNDGRLGRDGHSTTPGIVKNTKNIKSISAGYGSSLLIDTSGKVFSFGANYNGELGLGREFDREDDVNQATPIKYMKSPVKEISVGGDYSLLIS